MNGFTFQCNLGKWDGIEDPNKLCYFCVFFVAESLFWSQMHQLALFSIFFPYWPNRICVAKDGCMERRCQGLVTVVQGSLLGSVLSNLLLAFASEGDGREANGMKTDP